MKQLTRGILISVEGIDGSGKSTLVSAVVQLFSPTVLVQTTCEPGGTEFGKQLRTLVQQQMHPIDTKTEFLLYAADRAQHFHEIIAPALEHKQLVISDRLHDSSVVYQGYVRGLDLTIINQVNRWVMRGIEPDLVLYIKLSPEDAYQRLMQQPKNQIFYTVQSREQLAAFEKNTKELINKILTGYARHFAQQPHVVTLDGTREPRQLAHDAYTAINDWLIANAMYE